MPIVSSTLLVIAILYGIRVGAVETRLPSLRARGVPARRWGLPWSFRDPGLFTPEGQDQQTRSLAFLRRMYLFGFLFFVSRCAGL